MPASSPRSKLTEHVGFSEIKRPLKSKLAPVTPQNKKYLDKTNFARISRISRGSLSSIQQVNEANEDQSETQTYDQVQSHLMPTPTHQVGP